MVDEELVHRGIDGIGRHSRCYYRRAGTGGLGSDLAGHPHPLDRVRCLDVRAGVRLRGGPAYVRRARDSPRHGTSRRNGGRTEAAHGTPA